MDYSRSFPITDGLTPTEGHARYCRDNGHAYHTVDGIDYSICPRCGEVKEGTLTEDVQVVCEMFSTCENEVTHVDDVGYIYCAIHGESRRRSGRKCRKMRQHELNRVRKGLTVERY